jgi:Fur family peroxide stress response transcriptional regulator
MDGGLQERLAAFEQRCRELGMPVTIQRRVIAESLLRRTDHPTVDQLTAEVQERLPGVSRTTVYRTLETLVDIGAASKACHPTAVARYDGRTDPHHHLVCMSCDRMVDIDDERLDTLPVPATTSQGFEVSDFRVQLRGKCKECSKNETERADAQGEPIA